MTIDFRGGDGLFDRVGKIGHLLNLLNTWLGGSSAGDLPVEMEDVLEEYDGETVEIRNTVAALTDAMETHQASGLTLAQSIQTAAQNTLIEMADADNPLEARTVTTAMSELIAQMIANSETVNASAVGVTVTPYGSNVGDAPVVVAMVDAKGRALENCYAESVMVRVSSNATAGSETGTVKGEANQATSKLSFDWPTGSGSSGTFTVKDPASAGLLANGDFETFTVSNTPDDWTIESGGVGTEIKEAGGSNQYRGTNALLLDEGASTCQLYQSVSGVTSRTLYAVSVWTKITGPPASNSLDIELYNQTGGTVSVDDQGNANRLTIDVTSETTSYANHTAVWTVADPVPASLRIRIRMSNPLGSGEEVYIDDLVVTPMETQLYSGGPTVAVIRGATDLSLDDYWTLAVTNDGAGAFQTLFNKLFNQPTLLLPSNSAGGETVNDNLIG